jgi:hypothetical protein
MQNRTLTIVVAAILATSLAKNLEAQSGTRGQTQPRGGTQTQGSASRSGTPAQGSAPRPERPFEERLWGYLAQAQYQNWGPLPGQTNDAYPGNSPHGAKVKLYVNRLAAGRPGEFPYGSMLVKENYDESGNRLMAVTVMYRSKGFAQEAGEWYWAKYEADGRASQMNGRAVAGRVSMCIECHSSAGGDDYVFANDR